MRFLEEKNGKWNQKIDKINLEGLDLTDIRNLLSKIGVYVRVEHKSDYKNFQRLFHIGLNVSYWEKNRYSLTQVPDSSFLLTNNDEPGDIWTR